MALPTQALLRSTRDRIIPSLDQPMAAAIKVTEGDKGVSGLLQI
jgi:hypothetical protein